MIIWYKITPLTRDGHEGQPDYVYFNWSINEDPTDLEEMKVFEKKYIAKRWLNGFRELRWEAVASPPSDWIRIKKIELNNKVRELQDYLEVLKY